MGYIPLKKLYYINEQQWKEEYEKRFNSFGAKHFGVIINQYNRSKGYEAFLCYTDEIIQLIENIYALNTEFAMLKNSLPETVMQQFILKCITEEIKSTNDIEGVRSTRREIRAWLEHLPDTEKHAHLRTIIEKYSSICEGAETPFYTCQDIRNFYDGFVLDEVLSENPRNAPDGKIFRKDQVEIQSGVVGKIVHQGLYPESAIIDTMEKALAVLHDNKLSYVLRIAVFHYLFAYIHPFYDGNGRVDRFISSYYLSKEFDPAVALRLSVVIKRKRSAYYKQFENADSEINRGDLTEFCTYFLGCVLEAFKDTVQALTHKSEQLSRYKERINLMKLGVKEKAVYSYLLEAALFYGMGVTIKQLMGLTGYSRVTVQKLIDGMPESALLADKRVKPYRYKLNLLCLRG